MQFQSQSTCDLARDVKRGKRGKKIRSREMAQHQSGEAEQGGEEEGRR